MGAGSGRRGVVGNAVKVAGNSVGRRNAFVDGMEGSVKAGEGVGAW